MQALSGHHTDVDERLATCSGDATRGVESVRAAADQQSCAGFAVGVLIQVLFYHLSKCAALPLNIGVLSRLTPNARICTRTSL
jgi:hypothetical protein